MAKLPLEGIRVLEITVVWAGPHSSQILADWGADVIRVESTQFLGTTTRTGLMRPERNYFKVMIEMGYGYAGGYPESRAWDRGALFNTHARNKSSMTVDVTRPEGLEIFKDLISKSDVFIENNMPDTMKKLGLVYSELKKHNPGLIMVRMPAFGLEGKYHRYRSWGQHVEGVAGHSWLKGYRDTDISQRPESNQSDSGAAYSAVLAVLMAIRHRNLTGEGQLVEIPLCENFIPSLAAPIIDYTMNGRVRSSLGNGHTSMAPHGVYRCKGPDSWVAISVGSDSEWECLCQVLGNPEWTREKRFRTVLGRWNNQEELDQTLNQWAQTLTPYEVTDSAPGASGWRQLPSSMKRASMPILMSRHAGSSRPSTIPISGLTIISGSCGRWPGLPTPFGSHPLTWVMEMSTYTRISWGTTPSVTNGWKKRGT